MLSKLCHNSLYLLHARDLSPQQLGQLTGLQSDPVKHVVAHTPEMGSSKASAAGPELRIAMDFPPGRIAHV